MMGCSLRAGVCVVFWVMAVVRAQAGGNVQAADSTAGPFPTLDGVRRFINGPTSTSVDTTNRMLSRTTLRGLERIGGRVEQDPNGDKWFFKGHVYGVEDDAEIRASAKPVDGQRDGVQRTWRGEATQEGPHHPYDDLEFSDGTGQVSGASGDQAREERPDSHLDDPGENKSSPVPDGELPDWSKDSSQWMYRDGDWEVVRSPDSTYPLPVQPHPTASLVVASKNKVEVERNVSGLANVTLHYRFYLSENQDPDTKPELKVYHVVDGTRNLLQEETEQGDWYARTLEVPQADISSILFEGWRKVDSDVIALSNVNTRGIALDMIEPLDSGDQLTLTAAQPNMTESLASMPMTEGNQTLDSEAPQEVSPATDVLDQDNNTATSVPPAGTQLDLSSISTANTSQSLAEGEEAANNVTETPMNSSEVEASTDNPENETQTSEQLDGSTDIVALNSSMTGVDNATSDGGESYFFNSTTSTDEEESETDEGAPMTTTVIDDETSTAEPILGIDGNANYSSTASIPGMTTDTLQTNTSDILPVTSTTSGPLTNTGIYGNRDTPSWPTTRTEFTDEEQSVSKDVLGGDESTSGTTFGTSQSNGTSGNVTSPSGVTVSVEGTVSESTVLPSLVSNSTEAVMAVPVSSTSWQVFQVFLVLCVLGLLALGFLYWKRRRRQDDEIPVFTRHTDYHNPTFSMEDAANFMSRAGRNTYKTIE